MKNKTNLIYKNKVDHSSDASYHGYPLINDDIFILQVTDSYYNKIIKWIELNIHNQWRKTRMVNGIGIWFSDKIDRDKFEKKWIIQNK